MKLGDERFEKRRASLRREILMTRINEMPVTKQMLDRGIQFALEWTLGIPTQDMNEPSDGLYVEWMLNVNYGTREMRVAEALKSGIQIPEKGD